ncbi:MAG TPA: ECF transporter S component, partial [Bacillota bacterium]|nr:ECF transporter S component [Bacillota bacterium]
MSGSNARVRYVVWTGFMIAIAFVLMFLEVNLPLLPPYLRYDLGDFPALVTGFALGPGAAVAVELGKEFLFFVSGRNPTVIGMVANMLAGAAWVVPSALLYRRWHSKSGAVASLVLGALVMNVVMFAANGLFLLRAYGIPAAAVQPTLLAAILPFNLVKVCLTSVVTFALYKRVRVIF